MNVGRPKDLSKRKLILEAAKRLFLQHGFHGSSMNQIAKEAGVTKLTVYNHFHDKTNLFTCAIAETCEESIRTYAIEFDAQSDFKAVLAQRCEMVMNIVSLPEAIKLEHVLIELAAQQNPLVEPFYNASHRKLFLTWTDFFERAIAYQFIQKDDVNKQTALILSLLLGHRHHEVLLGLRSIPTAEEVKHIIQDSIEIFLLKYQIKS